MFNQMQQFNYLEDAKDDDKRLKSTKDAERQ